jgi:Uma2 family endonuclease
VPQTVEQPTETNPSPFRVRWTRADCERFVESGLLEAGKYELIEGDILRKTGLKRPHTASVALLFAWLIGIFGGDYVQTQGVVNVAPEDNPTSEPEPDVFVLNRPASDFPVEYPTPADLTLVAEISDSILAFDRSTKAGLYARAGIVEYWIVDLPGRAILVHRDPREGRYASVTRYSGAETVALLARPDAATTVESLLPPLPPARTPA